MRVIAKTSKDCMENFDELLGLIGANWVESKIPIEMSAEDTRLTYQHLANSGVLFLVVVYDDKTPIGYCATTILPHMLNHSVKTVNASGLYVLPKYRKGRALALIMREVASFARHHDAHSIVWHAPANSEFEKALDLRFKKLNSYYMEAIL